MPIITGPFYDAIVVDEENHVIAVVEVKTHPPANWTSTVQRLLARFDRPVAFVLMVDLDTIQLYQSEGTKLEEPIARLDTMHILSHYDPQLSNKRLFDSYLLTLVEAWLRDLAYHWKSANPPGAEELKGTGLLEKLEGGTTVRFPIET